MSGVMIRVRLRALLVDSYCLRVVFLGELGFLEGIIDNEKFLIIFLGY
jgi:hypothetical protein